MTATWTPEGSGPRDKYDLGAQLDEQRGLRDATVGRAHLLHRTLEDPFFERVVFASFLAGDAVVLGGRFFECRFEAPELSATRFENGFFRGTCFLRAVFRSVVFRNCVFDRVTFDVGETPGPDSLRFERCVFVEPGLAWEKRGRDAGWFDAGCRFVAAVSAVGSAPKGAGPVATTAAVPAPVGSAAPPKTAAAPVEAASAGAPAGGRFSALER